MSQASAHAIHVASSEDLGASGAAIAMDEQHADWRQRATISVSEYAAILGVGLNTAYDSVRAGEVATIKVRGRILVCVKPLLRKLEGL